jgi:hypothetical protein
MIRLTMDVYARHMDLAERHGSRELWPYLQFTLLA